MKIGLISPYDITVPSGVNNHVAQLACQFRAQGHQVRIVAPGPPADDGAPEVVRLGRAFPFPSGGSVARVTISPWLGGHIARLLAREELDVLHLHEPLISSLTLLTLRQARVPLVGTFHAARESGRSRGYDLLAPLLRPLAARLDGRIAVSPAAARLASRYFPGEYEVIPNGVDVESFSRAWPCPPAIAPWRPYVLFVGRFEDRKGLPILLDALDLLRQRTPGLHLVVVGDGRSRGHYERIVRERQLRNVHFVGRVGDELAGYYQHAAVYCAPNSGNESFGIVLLEAMAAGCPVVASGIEGFRAVVRDGVDGLLVPPNDAGAFAAALQRVLGDAGLTAALVAGGHERAREHDWCDIADRVLSYYERVIVKCSTQRA